MKGFFERLVREALRKKEEEMEKKYEVSGLHCQGCVSIMRGELMDLEGISKVDVSDDFKVATISGEGIDDEKVKAAIEEAGYELVKAL